MTIETLATRINTVLHELETDLRARMREEIRQEILQEMQEQAARQGNPPPPNQQADR